MAITSIIYYVVVTRDVGLGPLEGDPARRRVPRLRSRIFRGQSAKFFSGGWFPLAMAIFVFLVMTTWKKGRAMLARSVADRLLPIDMFLTDLASIKPTRVPGTAVFMSSNPNGVPIVLLHHWKHNQVLHETVVLLSVISETSPRSPAAERIVMKDLGQGFYFPWRPTTVSCRRPTCRRCCGAPPPSTMCRTRRARRATTSVAKRCSPRRRAACTHGARCSFPSSPETRARQRSISASLPTAWWSWACRSISIYRSRAPTCAGRGVVAPPPA